jgi:Ca2+-transporting ATPase
LWINLVTDGLPGLALASEPAEGNEAAAKGPTTKYFFGKMALHIISVVANGFGHSGHSVLGYSR